MRPESSEDEARGTTCWSNVAATRPGSTPRHPHDSNQSPEPTSSNDNPGQSLPELVIGDGYVGGMKSFNWYDWSAPQLVTFNDGSTNTRVTFDSTGQVVLPIRSTGQLNQHQAHAALNTMRVATTVTPVGGALPSGFVTEQRQFISLLSVDGYYAMASVLVESPSLFSGLPALGPIQFTSVPRHWLGQMVPTAHAQVTVEGVFTAFKEVFNFAIPWQDAIVLSQQVYKLITAAEDFSWSEMAFAAIGVLSIVPILKPLKFVSKSKPLIRMLALVRNSKFTRHLAGALEKVIAGLASNRGQRLLDIAPFLILIAELAATEEGRDSVMFMANSIASSDDLWAWVSYFNLPVGGWTEGTEPPAVGLVAANDTMAMNDNGVMFAGLAGVVPVAHAQGTGRAARVGRALLQKAIKAAQEGLAEAGGNPADFTRFLRTVAKSHGITTSDVTKILRDPNYIKMQMRLLLQKGEAATKRALRDDPDDRIRLYELAGISAFLTAEAVAGKLLFDGQTLARTKVTLAKALGACFVGLPISIHGARFEFMMLAELQLIGRFGNSRVAGFQVTVPVKLFQNKANRQAGQPTLNTYDRRVDMVTREGAKEIWWEVKSLRDGSERTGFPTWTLSRAGETSSGTSYHREFVSDRSMLLRKADNVTRVDERAPSSVHWVFHSFSTRNGVGSMDRPSVAIAAEHLCKNPNGSRDQIYGTFGKGPSAALRQCGATKNPIGIELIEESGLPIDVEHITVQLRDMRDRLLSALTEGAHLPAFELPAP